MKTLTPFEKRVQCLTGTFAVENMTIPESVHRDLQRMENNEVSLQQLLADAKQRYSIKQ